MLPLANRAQTSSICSQSAWSQCAETIQISSGVKPRRRVAVGRRDRRREGRPHQVAASELADPWLSP